MLEVRADLKVPFIRRPETQRITVNVEEGDEDLNLLLIFKVLEDPLCQVVLVYPL